ncbi:MAG: hypothetical protein L6Q99_06075 [Planctomycetes bacterium]|nr:hypothetical protein [Planctomycetota bacterium]
MNTRTKVSLAVGIFAGSVLVLIGYGMSRRAQSPEPLPELVTTPTWMGTGRKIKSAENLRVFVDIDTLNQELTVRRQSRLSSSSEWTVSSHTESASFHVVDASAGCQAEILYVTGVYPDGSSTIERWTYTYPPIVYPIGGGTGIQHAPKVRRRVLFQGIDYGHIRTLEADPEQRFLFFLTAESSTLMRMELPSGDVGGAAITPASIPAMSQMKSIGVRQFTTLGRVYVLRADDRRSDMFDYSNTTLIVLPDANNDGQFDAPYTTTMDDWNAADMDRSPPNVDVCP